jgi:hypothetical protein
MDKREALKSMLTNLINDKPEEASLDLHSYMTDKMREVAGLGGAPAAEVVDDEQEEIVDTENEPD